MTPRGRTFMLAGMLLATGVAGDAQQSNEGQPVVTFRQEVNYVEVDAVVTDAQGNFVRDLAQTDVQVLEDGKPQAITTFSLVDIPIERADRPLFTDALVPADTRSNEGAFTGRVYVLALDDLHTNALRSNQVKAAARRFIQRYVADNDIVAVVHTSGRADAGQEFTGSKPLMLAAVDKFMGRKTRSGTLEKIDSYFNTRGTVDQSDQRRIDDPSDFERGYNASAAMGTMKNLADYLAGVRGRRKALVFFSEGIDYDIYDVFNARYASSVLDDVREAIGAATRGNVSIYAVDPRGLTALGDDAIEIASLPDDTTLGLGPNSLQSELRLAQDSLRVLADETGGFAVVNTNDFSSAFERVVRDNSSYYILGYYPTNDRRDGKLRKIQVRVNRPGLQVRARKGYVAPRGRAPRETDAAAAGAGTLREVMQSPLQTSGLPMSLHAAPFKGVAPNASVAIALQFGAGAFPFTEKDGLFHNELEVSTLAIDSAGKSFPGERTSLKLDLRPQTHQTMQKAGIRLQVRMPLPPGRYQLRVAAREAVEGRVGSVFADLEVPDFAKEGLAMSGVLLTSTAAAATPTAKADEQFRDVLPGPATTVREFGVAETLATFVEVYDGTKVNEHKVDLTTEVLTTEGRSVFKTVEERSKTELQGSKGGYGHAARVPLREIGPGLFVLRVTAASRLSDVAPVSREMPFRVRGDGSPTSQTPPPAPTGVPPPAPTVVPAPAPAPTPAAAPPPVVPPAAAAAPTAPAATPSAPADATPPAAPAPIASASPAAAPAARPMQVVNVRRGAQSSIDSYREVVARTPEEFAALWSAAGLTGAPPNVNFTTTMLVGVFLGSRPTAGYGVDIVAVERAGDVLDVQYREQAPAPDTMRAQVLTFPFHVVGVPRHEGAVRFVKAGAP